MRRVVPFGLLIVSACATVPLGNGDTAWTPDVRPAAYLPLQVGTSWAYEVFDPTFGKTSPLVIRVEARIDDQAILSPEAGLVGYQDLGDRILALPSRKPILVAPIVVNARWRLPRDGGGGSATITSVDAVVDTPAGRYTGCVTVEERTLDERIFTHYAPGVGPVKIEHYAHPKGLISAGSIDLLRRAVLRSFHRAAVEIAPGSR